MRTLCRADHFSENRFSGGKQELPLAWAGLTDAEFEAVSGVPGARFCHNARFIAVAADRQAALHLAELAVRDATA